jgi:hypothetical protein
MTETRISIKDDFTRTPGHRSESDGPYSGEAFLRKILRPKYVSARERHTRLYVDLDGVAGYATSFLEASFGGLARAFPIDEVVETIVFKSDEEPYLINEIRQYMQEARGPAATDGVLT